MRDRTPKQIIGSDALIQLKFEGYAVVPVKPTEAMMSAVGLTTLQGRIWSLMISAALNEEG